MPPPPILFAKDYGADVDPSRWVVIYPPYIDRLRTEAEGRKISKAKCVEKPTAREVFDCCQMLNLQTAFEYNKAYSRDYLQRGRIRVKLFNDDKSPVREDIASRRILYARVAGLIPTHREKMKVKMSKSEATSGAKGGASGAKPKSGKAAPPPPKKKKKGKR